MIVPKNMKLVKSSEWQCLLCEEAIIGQGSAALHKCKVD